MAKVKRYSAGNYVTSEDSNSGMEEAYNNAQAELRGEEILKGMRDEAATVSPAKPKIITKEELAKSGLSLRDYMNQQQGLTRRGESKVTDTGDETARLAARMPKPGLKYQSLQDREIENQAKRRAAGRSFYGTKTMASGGTASSRADGCCVKGKTKGKYL
jgi:hypothetical protein